MKRPSLHLSESYNSYNSSSMSDDGELLGQSLKRVRISTSPGELRLDRDLHQLGWSTANRFLNHQIWLDRVHALRLVLVISGRVTLHVEIPRMYPHEAPKLVHVKDEGGNTAPLSLPLVYTEWSPIQTIQEYIHFLLEQLQGGGMAVDSMEEAAKHQSLFAPNRFDVGYDRSIPAKAMEC